MKPLMLLTLTIIAQAGNSTTPPGGGATPSPGASAAATPSVKIESVWDFVVKGGPVMIPIGICSLIALTVIIERLFTLRRDHVIPKGFLPGLRSVMDRSEPGNNRALAYCQSSASPLANIVAAGLRKWGAPRDTLEKAVADAGEREVNRLRKYLRVLSLIIAVSPLLGLLGTILGMISAFQTVAASGENLGRTELLAKGIYEAMITTAAGLIVTIPALACYHGLCAKISRLVDEMDLLTIEFFEDLASGAEAGQAAHGRVEAAAETAVSESENSPAIAVAAA